MNVNAKDEDVLPSIKLSLVNSPDMSVNERSSPVTSRNFKVDELADWIRINLRRVDRNWSTA